jgi:hypothetical protein
MHQYPQVGLLTVFKCVKGGAVFERHMSGFCCEAVGKLAILVTSVARYKRNGARLEGRNKWRDKKKGGPANAVLCVCSVSSIISFNCTIRHAAVPPVSTNSVPLLRLGVTLHSLSPASRHFPSPLTKQV